MLHSFPCLRTHYSYFNNFTYYWILINFYELICSFLYSDVFCFSSISQFLKFALHRIFLNWIFSCSSVLVSSMWKLGYLMWWRIDFFPAFLLDHICFMCLCFAWIIVIICILLIPCVEIPKEKLLSSFPAIESCYLVCVL